MSGAPMTSESCLDAPSWDVDLSIYDSLASLLQEEEEEEGDPHNNHKTDYTLDTEASLDQFLKQEPIQEDNTSVDESTANNSVFGESFIDTLGAGSSLIPAFATAGAGQATIRYSSACSSGTSTTGSNLGTTAARRKSSGAPNKRKFNPDADIIAATTEATLMTMDVDPHSKDGKKARRQIRNRLSAQFHRDRKNSHIAELEQALKCKDEEIAKLRAQVATLTAEITALRCDRSSSLDNAINSFAAGLRPLPNLGLGVNNWLSGGDSSSATTTATSMSSTNNSSLSSSAAASPLVYSYGQPQRGATAASGTALTAAGAVVKKERKPRGSGGRGRAKNNNVAAVAVTAGGGAAAASGSAQSTAVGSISVPAGLLRPITLMSMICMISFLILSQQQQQQQQQQQHHAPRASLQHSEHVHSDSGSSSSSSSISSTENPQNVLITSELARSLLEKLSFTTLATNDGAVPAATVDDTTSASAVASSTAAVATQNSVGLSMLLSTIMTAGSQAIQQVLLSHHQPPTAVPAAHIQEIQNEIGSSHISSGRHLMAIPEGSADWESGAEEDENEDGEEEKGDGASNTMEDQEGIHNGMEVVTDVETDHNQQHNDIASEDSSIAMDLEHSTSAAAAVGHAITEEQHSLVAYSPASNQLSVNVNRYHANNVNVAPRIGVEPPHLLCRRNPIHQNVSSTDQNHELTAPRHFLRHRYAAAAASAADSGSNNYDKDNSSSSSNAQAYSLQRRLVLTGGMVNKQMVDVAFSHSNAAGDTVTDTTALVYKQPLDSNSGGYRMPNGRPLSHSAAAATATPDFGDYGDAFSGDGDYAVNSYSAAILNHGKVLLDPAMSLGRTPFMPPVKTMPPLHATQSRPRNQHQQQGSKESDARYPTNLKTLQRAMATTATSGNTASTSGQPLIGMANTAAAAAATGAPTVTVTSAVSASVVGAAAVPTSAPSSFPAGSGSNHLTAMVSSSSAVPVPVPVVQGTGHHQLSHTLQPEELQQFQQQSDWGKAVVPSSFHATDDLLDATAAPATIHSMYQLPSTGVSTNLNEGTTATTATSSSAKTAALNGVRSDAAAVSEILNQSNVLTIKVPASAIRVGSSWDDSSDSTVERLMQLFSIDPPPVTAGSTGTTKAAATAGGVGSHDTMMPHAASDEELDHSVGKYLSSSSATEKTAAGGRHNLAADAAEQAGMEETADTEAEHIQAAYKLLHNDSRSIAGASVEINCVILGAKLILAGDST